MRYLVAVFGLLLTAITGPVRAADDPAKSEAAPVAQAPQAAESASYAADGWIARCDAHTCRASHASEAGDAALLLGRWADGRGIAIGFATPHAIADRDRPVDLQIDDRAVETLRPGRDFAALEHAESFWIIDPSRAAALAKALTTGKRLRISYLDMIGAPHDALFPLDGIAAVAAFMGKSLPGEDTTTAGIAPPKSVAVAPVTRRIDLIARMGVPDRLMARHVASALGCEDPTSARLKAAPPVIGALSPVAILYAIPCIVAPKATAYRIWVIETGEIGGITPQYFALYDPKFGWKGSDLLYNVAYDEAMARLTSDAPHDARACGHHATWRWKDYAFALETFDVTPSCPGVRASRIYPPK